MEIGTGIAIGCSVLGAVAVIFKIFPSAKAGESFHCPEHSGLCEGMENLKDWLSKIERKLDRVIEGQGK